MDKQYLNKKKLEKRIERLNDWLIQNPDDPMAGTAKNEVLYYINLLSDLKDSFSQTIQDQCPTQIHQQIGTYI